MTDTGLLLRTNSTIVYSSDWKASIVGSHRAGSLDVTFETVINVVSEFSVTLVTSRSEQAEMWLNIVTTSLLPQSGSG